MKQESLTCNLCHETKPVSGFYRRPQKARGYEYACKVCSIKRHSGYAKVPAHNKTYRDRHRDRYVARTRLNDAVASGKIKRPSICPKCDSHKRVQAHHEDYSKPLEVVWLCTQCHYSIHHNRELVK